jgi:hypothetical protein
MNARQGASPIPYVVTAIASRTLREAKEAIDRAKASNIARHELIGVAMARRIANGM